jgi:hypothetical protein
LKHKILIGILATLLTGIVLAAPFSFSNNHLPFAEATVKANTSKLNSSSNMILATTNSLNNAINKLNFTKVVGIMSSLQNASGKPAWIVDGQFQMLLLKSRLEENRLQPALTTHSTILSMVL